MKKNTRKTANSLWLFLFFSCVLWVSPLPASASPYSLFAAFARGADGGAYLGVTVTPEQEGVYLYGSRSQAAGRVTEITAAVDGVPLGSFVIFPRAAEKPDPLNPGSLTKVFDGAFTAFIPVRLEDIGGKRVDVRLAGLACSDVNCTPLDMSLSVPVPDPFDPASFRAISEVFGQDVPDYAITEPMPPLRKAPLADMPPSFGTVPAIGSGKSVPFAAPGAFLASIAPEPFAPDLEVSSLGKAVFLGFLAGLLLNLMPCVLPVLGIKISSLLRHGTDAATVRRFRRHQLFFAFGILAWFAVLAGLFHWLDLAWGQIFQSPAVVLALAVMLFLLALNLFGVLTLPLIDFRMGNPGNPDMQAFASGFAATLLATPCGGPLLGGVLSWALMQPLGLLALAMLSVGLGMASPYLLLAAFPGAASRFPRPGRWMGVLEHVLAFLLLATVAYLVSFLPVDILPRVVAAFVLVAFGGWLWGRGGGMEGTGKRAVRLAAVICIAMACIWPFALQPATGKWEDYSHAAFEASLGSRVILVDFTADWCPTCKVVEATALREANLRAWEKDYGVKLFRVDITRENPEGEALLRAVGSVSIPVVAVFRAGDGALSPLVLRDVVTGGQIEEALKEASRK